MTQAPATNGFDSQGAAIHGRARKVGSLGGGGSALSMSGAAEPLGPAHRADAGGGVGRRELLRAAAVVPLLLAGGSAAANSGSSLPGGFWDRPRSIWLRRVDTGEESRLTYWADGRLVERSYEQLCWLMRDRHIEREINAWRATGRQPPRAWHSQARMSVVLLDILYATCGWLEFHDLARPLALSSGFRHPRTNGATEGAAPRSLHREGRAADIVVPGVTATSVASFGAWLRGGGIGWYPNSQFTHVDDGRLRLWRG